jgi:hypothetical protein
MIFDQVYESYCLMFEQPHITIGNKDFDLEVEEYKNNLKGLVVRLHNVLNLIPVPNSIKPDRSHDNFVFDSKEDANKYWEELTSSFMFQNMLKFLFKIDVKKLSKMVGK